MSDAGASSSEAFDMNALLRGEVQDDQQAREREETESVGGRSDAGAGQDRTQTGARDMNAWLRDAVSESRGRPA